MMQTKDHIAHYRRDAQSFDYFCKESSLDADSTSRLRQGIERTIPVQPGGKVLDVGSGSGWLADRVLRRNSIYIAVDLSPENLIRLRSHSSGQIFAVVADAARLPFKDGVLDHIVASEVLEHVNEPELVVREGYRVLRIGGQATFSTPFREILRYYLCIHCNEMTPANAHLHSFDQEDHHRIMRNAGFSMIRSQVIQDKVFLALRLSLVLRHLPWSAWRLVDRFFQFFFRRPLNIITTAKKP